MKFNFKEQTKSLNFRVWLENFYLDDNDEIKFSNNDEIKFSNNKKEEKEKKIDINRSTEDDIRFLNASEILKDVSRPISEEEMQKLFNVPSRECYVYHYTNNEGIKGIVSSRKFNTAMGEKGKAVYFVLKANENESNEYYSFVIEAKMKMHRVFLSDTNFTSSSSYSNENMKCIKDIYDSYVSICSNSYKSGMLKAIFYPQLQNICDKKYSYVNELAHSVAKDYKFMEKNIPATIVGGRGGAWAVVYDPNILTLNRIKKIEDNNWYPATQEGLNKILTTV